MIITPLFAHYLKALNPFWFAVRDRYRFLSSDQAIETYRLIWNLMQLVCWLAVWLTSSTLKLGRGCRRYYQAEWS